MQKTHLVFFLEQMRIQQAQQVVERTSLSTGNNMQFCHIPPASQVAQHLDVWPPDHESDCHLRGWTTGYRGQRRLDEMANMASIEALLGCYQQPWKQHETTWNNINQTLLRRTNSFILPIWHSHQNRIYTVYIHMAMDQYHSIPINTIFRGMNIHESQLFWCFLGHSITVLTHPHLHTLW